MALVETHSPEAAYASKDNIVVPHPRAGGKPASAVAALAKTHSEQRLRGAYAGKTLSAAPTPRQEP
jgi:hypothetical protein